MALFQFLGHLYIRLQSLLLLRGEFDASLHRTMSKKNEEKSCLKQKVFNLNNDELAHDETTKNIPTKVVFSW